MGIAILKMGYARNDILVLAIKREDDIITALCPFVGNGSGCGTWCPALEIKENKVLLNCFPHPVLYDLVNSIEMETLDRNIDELKKYAKLISKLPEKINKA